MKRKEKNGLSMGEFIRRLGLDKSPWHSGMHSLLWVRFTLLLRIREKKKRLGLLLLGNVVVVARFTLPILPDGESTISG